MIEQNTCLGLDLVLQGLSKTYPGEVHALVNATLRVREARITALLGPNGAGKTTLVNCTAGLVLPDSGSIEYRGRDLIGRPNEACDWIAFMFEEAENVYGYLTVEENLAYFSYLNQAAIKPATLDKYLRFFALHEKRNVEGFRLSRGMKQKLAILIALLKGTDLLILDEPTLGLDVASRRQMIAFLQRLRDDHDKTVLLTTHDMALAQEVSDDYAFIHRGRIVWSGSNRELAERLGETTLESSAPLPLEEAFLRLTGEWEGKRLWCSTTGGR